MTKFYSIVFLFFLSCFSVVISQEELPLKNISFSKLSENKSEILEANLIAELSQNTRWNQLIKSKRMSIAVVDLTDVNNVKYAGVNANHMVYAASLPKIAILYAVMHAIDKGEIKDTEATRKDLRLMISKSNNAAATRMIDLVGYKKIEAVLRMAKIPLYNKENGGGLWVGKRYASKGKRYPDPLKGISHAATAYQAANFYYLLAYGKLISYTRSKEMLDILKDPEINHKLVNTLSSLDNTATLYRKSGTWKYYHTDSVLVWGENRKYILIALIEDAKGEHIIRNLVKPVETALQKSR